MKNKKPWIFKTTRITEPCYGVIIETEETKKGRREPFIGSYSGIKKRYKITYEQEMI